jgi:Flp pilus assembly protein TadD
MSAPTSAAARKGSNASNGHSPFEPDRNQALALAQEGSFAEAEICARQVLEAQPDDIDLLNALGVSLWRQGRAAEAEDVFRRAIAFGPKAAVVWTNLGLFLAEHARKAEAADAFRTALGLQPESFIARMNLGIALSDLGRFDEASESLEAALDLQPQSPEAFQHVGLNLSRQLRWAEAVEYYEAARRLQPNSPEIRSALGAVLIGAGDFARGWPEYEWRLNCHPNRGLRINRTFWNGDDFRDQTILLHFEQGYGDTLQFIRFAPLVKRRGGRVVLLCQPPLVRLLARSPGIDLACDGLGYEPECHIHAPLLSLPAILGTTLDNLPAQVPYLFADSVLVEHWRAEILRAVTAQGNNAQEPLDGAGGLCPDRPFLIGIAWQGHREHDRDRWRSVPLAQFAPLAAVPRVRLISLQVGDGRDHVEALDGRFPVIDLPGRRGRDFSETAAIMGSLDLVITPDTAVAHLAGGLGIPVWTALNRSCDWRWHSGSGDSPWYPTMKLFRQDKLGEWEPVFERMAECARRRTVLGTTAAASGLTARSRS